MAFQQRRARAGVDSATPAHNLNILHNHPCFKITLLISKGSITPHAFLLINALPSGQPRRPHQD